MVEGRSVPAVLAAAPCPDSSVWGGGLPAGTEAMERFLGFVKQIRRSRRRKGKKYRPEEDYHEGYEDVYYYASEHFQSKCFA